MAAATETQTLNLPSLFLVSIILILSIRYFFFAPSPHSTSSTSRNRHIADPAQIEQIASMFPQLSRRDIQWDLQRNGGSVQATTERVLGGRGLERPPPSFQPLLPPPTPNSSRSTSNPPSAPTKSLHPDLITRYNLASRVSTQSPQSSAPVEVSEKGTEKGTQGGQGGWSQNKAERQALLKKRREDMVLLARRRMEERERERVGGK
ncbi:MAG: hypothetical protein Q9220_004798 [cf. Caloplaca sp. 1 TL-2023]